MRLKDKVVVVVGVGPGMGKAMALLFAQEGARVALLARKSELINKISIEIREITGQETVVAQADMTVRSEIERAIKQTVKTFGQLDAIVALPGGGFRHVNDLVDTDENFFKLQMNNHLTSLYNSVLAAVPFIKMQKNGSIITLAASNKTLRDGNVAYSMVKHGVIGFTKNLARELYPNNIRVNCLCPGLIRKPLATGKINMPELSLNRRGQPEDIAYAALYLISDEAPWITGQTLTIDGGNDVMVGQPRIFD